MKERYNNGKVFDPFTEVNEPDIVYQDGKKELSIYFIDDYPFKQKALENRIFHIRTDMNQFDVLLEKEIYDLVPDYYSKESLAIQCDYYGNVTRKNLRKLTLGGLVVGIAITFILIATALANVIVSSVIGLIAAILYMYLYLNTVFQSNLNKGREDLRNDLVALLGTNRLEEINKVQEKYLDRREKEVAKIKEEREKSEKKIDE